MQHIRASFDSLTESHPGLRQQLEAGLLLALAGAVQQGKNGERKVRGGTVDNGIRKEYTVQSGNKWTCNCKAHEYQAPSAVNLLGHNGRICKHIAAVAILSVLSDLPESPANLLDLVHRLVLAQWMPAPPIGGKRRDLDLPGTPAKLIHQMRGSKPVACLKVGHKRSKYLVKWVTIPGQTNRGMWQLVPDAESRYREWVRDLGK